MDHAEVRTAGRGAALAVLLLAGGCGSTAYEPAGPLDPTGYESRQLTADRYLVRFEGGPDTSRQTVETYLLYRAAEIAAREDAPYFALVEDETEREVDVETYYPPTGFYGWGAGPAFGGAFGYGRFPYYISTPYFTGGPTVATFDTYEAFATVQLFDERPDDGANVLETAEVLRSLRPEVEPETG